MTYRVTAILLFFNSLLASGFSNDSILVIRNQADVFGLNPHTSVYKDYSGKLTYEEARKREADFIPIASENYSFGNDERVNTYWFRATVDNQTNEALRYVIYFHPGIDTVELWSEGKAGTQRTVLSSLAHTNERPIHIAQELCAPLLLHTGRNEIYFSVPNHSMWTKRLGGVIVNLAEEKTFLNYFLRARTLQSFVLGVIAIIVVLHFIIYLFLGENNYLLLVINLFFTLCYLVLLKHFQADLPFSPTFISLTRYWLNPLGFAVCISSLRFMQSFLDTREADVWLHNVSKGLILLGCVMLVVLLLMQEFYLMEIAATYFGLLTYLFILFASARAYLKGNVLAIYVFIGFFFFILPISVFIFPLSFTDFRSNETDYYYYAEALRAIVFAVGVADRFRRVQRDLRKLEKEKKQLELHSVWQLEMQREEIMRDLHDSLGGQLSSISLGLNQLVNGKAENLQAIQALTQKAMGELRDSLWVLDSVSISFAQLEQRINTTLWQYRKIEVPIDLQLRVDEALQGLTLPSGSIGNLFRIIHEAVNNSVTHSKGSYCYVAIEKVTGGICVTIADDGVGFDTATLPEAEHYGLKNMKARATNMGAEINIHSNNGSGTKVSLLLPI